MISALAVLITASAAVSAGGRAPALVVQGGDPAPGLLANHTWGARPFDPPDPSRPTVVFIHGMNPMPRTVHFTMARQVGEAFARRGGPPINVLGWEWNAATVVSLRSQTNSEAAVAQGRRLAGGLLQAGLDPSTIQLIGHSSGAMVATSAARDLWASTGRTVAGLTLLEPATCHHALIFQRLQAGSLAPIVENYWSPGPSAYGREVALPGVRDYRVEGTARLAGVVCPLRSDHLSVVHWYLDTIEHPDLPRGWNQSGLRLSQLR